MQGTRIVALLACVAAALLSGCSTSSGQKFQPEVSDPKKGLLYVFRESGGLMQSGVEISINQQVAGELHPGQYLVKSLPPDEYFVRAAAKSNMVRAVKLVEGDVVYLRVTTQSFGRKPHLDFPESDVARHMIANTTKLAE
jgi:hypothetical protein